MIKPCHLILAIWRK